MKRFLIGFVAALVLGPLAFAQSTQQPGPGPVPFVAGGGSSPSGPAAGDLGGDYPNPTVDSVAHITAGVLGATHGGAGTISGALKGNGSGVVSQAACADLSNGATGCSTVVGAAATANTGVSGHALPFLDGTNTWSGVQTQTGLTTTQPGWFAGLDTDTVARVRIGLTATDTPLLSFGAGGSSARDLFVMRGGAANLKLGGADAASPVAQTISVQNVVAGTTNTAGASTTIQGSQGTGTGVGGSIIFQTAPAGSTGTSVNALSTAFTISSTTITSALTQSTTTMQSTTAGGYRISGAGGTDTTATFEANRGDTTTGVGGASGHVSLVVGGASIALVTSTGLAMQAGVMTPKGFTVSTLPASPAAGSRAYVTDATSCTFQGALTGGGSTYCPVSYTGAAWVGG